MTGDRKRAPVRIIRRKGRQPFPSDDAMRFLNVAVPGAPDGGKLLGEMTVADHMARGRSREEAEALVARYGFSGKDERS